jgi:hypothetical protein
VPRRLDREEPDRTRVNSPSVSEDDYLGYLVLPGNTGPTGNDHSDVAIPQTLGRAGYPTRDVTTIGKIDLETAGARFQTIEVLVNPEWSPVVGPEYLETPVTTKNGRVGNRDPAVAELAIDQNLSDHAPGR